MRFGRDQRFTRSVDTIGAPYGQRFVRRDGKTDSDNGHFEVAAEFDCESEQSEAWVGGLFGLEEWSA